MTRKPAFALLVVASLVVLVLVASEGCGSAGASGDAGAGPMSGDDASMDATTDDGPNLVMESGAPQGLVVDPPTASMVVTDLTSLPSLPLAAKVTYSNGTTGVVPASWSVDRLDIATVGAGDGKVTAAGGAFGVATVTATALGLHASAAITVSLKTTVQATPVSAGDQGTLGSATAADPAVTTIAYPYDQTLFPIGLLPPEIMWNGGQPGDTYLLHFVGANFDLSVFTTADPPSRYTLPAPLWNALAASEAGASATVSLKRLSGGTAYASATETWKIARANLHGTIYYWSIADGQIIKLDLTTGARSPAFDSGSALVMGTPAPLDAGAPANPPWEDALPNHQRCVACHAVSKDGSTIASVFSRADSAGPFGYVDVAGASVKAIGDYAINGAFTALTPDGKYAAVNDNFMTLALADTSTGQLVPSLFDGQTNLCDPAFSPDGTRFAVATNCGLNDPQAYPVQYTTSDLSLFDFARSPAPAFSNPRVVLTGGNPDAGVADAIAFPSFSPDSQWLFFQRGNNSRAKINFGQNTHGSDDLYVTAAKAGSAPIALDRANGAGVLSADNLHLNYAPTVNPIAEGGYFWVVFTSPRDYGNRTGQGRVAGSTTYPGDATYANNKQLWVTAIDTNIQSGDPSHPAFWLPGQDVDSINMFGYWALAACKATVVDGGTSSCSAGFECCSGYCQGGVCSDQPSGCHQLGDACGSTADCCGSGSGTGNVACVAGICQAQGAL